MVRLTEKPYRRAASCWSRLVMNGGAGRWRDSLRSTLPTTNLPPSRSRTIRAASSPLPTSAFLPSTRWSRALNGGGTFPLRSAPRFQYSSATKTSISPWRSHTILSATDWTRPAESPCLTFSQRRGESRKPIMRSRTRRACWASTFLRSIVRGFSRALSTARLVISLKVTRRTSLAPFRISAMCQAMASPSRSGSGAR